MYVTTWSAAAREKIKINERKHFNKKKILHNKTEKRELNEYNNIIFKLLQIIFFNLERVVKFTDAHGFNLAKVF